MAPRDLRRTTALPQVFPQVFPQRPSRFTTALPQPLHTGDGLLLRLSCCCAAPGTHALTVRNRCHREDPIVIQRYRKSFVLLEERSDAARWHRVSNLYSCWWPSHHQLRLRLRAFTPMEKLVESLLEKLPLWKTPDGKLLMEKLWNGPAKKGRCHATYCFVLIYISIGFIYFPCRTEGTTGRAGSRSAASRFVIQLRRGGER